MSDFAKVGELYSTLSEALSAINARRADAALLTRVSTYFREFPPPEPLSSAPCGVYAPALVTPNLELQYLLDIADSLPIPMRYLEYAEDKFVHMNFAKSCLGRLVFFAGDTGNRQITGEKTVLDFQTSQGKPMSALKTFSGENFVEFHHRILRETLKDRTPHISDFSAWFKASASFDPDFPYLRYLGLFLTDAILFANFTTEKREAAFTESRVLPAFRRLKEVFGVTPLIVPIQPTENDDELIWCYYPEKVREYCT